MGSNSQPLKSRGYILVFGLAIQFFEGFQNLIPFLLTVEDSYKYEYIIQDVIFVSLRFSSYLLIILNMLRMFLFIKKKSQYLRSRSSNCIHFILFLLKNLTSDFGSFLGSLALFLYSISLHGNSFYLRLFSFLSFMDVILNLKFIFSDCPRYYFKSDPFAFRLQQLFIVLVIVVESLEIIWFWNGKRCLDHRKIFN